MSVMIRNLKSALFVVAMVAAAGCGGGDKKPAAPAPAAGGGDKAPAAAAPAAGGGKYDAAKSTASAKITVKWTGAKPTAVEKQISGDEFCKTAAGGKPVMDERFEINADGSLPHSFVWASEGPHKGMAGLPASAAFVLDQKGCMYVPHVFGVQVGQSFTVKNSDGTTHNVHCRPKTNKEFNTAQSASAQNEFTFTAKERAIPFNCDIHSWMSAYGFVLDHPFFGATGADGKVEIKGLPAGTYKFKVWHESFSADRPSIDGEFELVVKEGEAASKDVELK
jgi:plastocyanin